MTDSGKMMRQDKNTLFKIWVNFGLAADLCGVARTEFIENIGYFNLFDVHGS